MRGRCGLGSGAAPPSRAARESSGGEALREWKYTGGGRSGGCAPAGRRQGAWPLFTFSQLSGFASRSGDGSAVPGPPPPPLRPGWYREDVDKWRPQLGTYTPDPQMSDTAAPAPTKRRCSPSPGSPARPRPRQWHLPGLTSFLPLPPSLPPSFPPTRLRLRSGSRLPPPRLCADLWLPLVPSRLSLGPETPSSPGQGMRGVSLAIRRCYIRRWGCLRDRQEGFTVASRGPGPPLPHEPCSPAHTAAHSSRRSAALTRIT